MSELTSNPRYKEDRLAVESARSGAPPRPSILELHPSPVCQLRCVYCHSMAPPKNSTVYASPISLLLTTHEYDMLLRQFVQLGGETVVISGGGEPFLYKHILDLLTLVRKHGLAGHIYTNGIAPLLRDSPAVRAICRLDSIRFSLHASMSRHQWNECFASIRNIDAHRKSLGSDLVITASLLIDTLIPQRLAELASDLPAEACDSVELRHTLGNAATADGQAAVEAVLRDVSSLSHRVESADVPLVPLRCAALYRSLVVDPYGGYRTCCLRAHHPTSDFSHLGSCRTTRLSDALDAGTAAMSQVGMVSVIPAGNATVSSPLRCTSREHRHCDRAAPHPRHNESHWRRPPPGFARNRSCPGAASTRCRMWRRRGGARSSARAHGLDRVRH